MSYNLVYIKCFFFYIKTTTYIRNLRTYKQYPKSIYVSFLSIKNTQKVRQNTQHVLCYKLKINTKSFLALLTKQYISFTHQNSQQRQETTVTNQRASFPKSVYNKFHSKHISCLHTFFYRKRQRPNIYKYIVVLPLVLFIRDKLSQKKLIYLNYIINQIHQFLLTQSSSIKMN